MDPVQEAVATAEAGHAREAQLQLARLLKQEPQNIPAWLALSRLVEDRDKKRVFLRKVLTLDPQHELARRQLAALEHPTVTPDMPTLIEHSRPEPPEEIQIVDQPPATATPVSVAAEPLPDEEVTPAVDHVEEAPQASETPSTRRPEAAEVRPATAADAPRAATPAAERTDWLLIGLGGLAIVVGLVLIFLLLQYF